MESHRFLLRFEEPPFPRVHVGLHPSLSTLHLARGMKVPSSPTEVAVAMTRALEGRRVIGVEHPDEERLVKVVFEENLCLVAELMGKASNLLLLDARHRIVRFARSHEGEFRRPVEGERWQPPPPSSLWTVPAAGGLQEAPFRELLARAPASQAGGLAAHLGSSIPGLSGLVAREIEHRAGRGEDPWDVFRELRHRLAGREGIRPVVHAAAPLADLPEGEPVTGRRLFAFPFALDHAVAAGLIVTEFATMNEAEAAAAEARLRGLATGALRQSLGAQLRQEEKKARELIAALQRDLAAAEDSAVRDRRRGELILAGMRLAKKSGDRVQVPDVYEPGTPLVEIPIDPRLDLRANAERLFRAARRADRAREVIPGRLAAAASRQASITRASGRLESAGTRSELQALEQAMLDEGLVRAVRRAGRTETGQAAGWVPIREFKSAEGFTILVGRNASDNDHMTFHVAAPHDLWLHAAGQPGAHVIVRNPRRLP